MSDAVRLRDIRDEFDRLKLSQDILSRVWQVNGASNQNPYHGFQHLLTVSLRAIEGGRFYGLEEVSLQKLAVAGLVHDLGYRVGESESVNIPRAQELTLDLFGHGFGDGVNILIAATEFPHGRTRTIEEKIIQDADFMQNLEPDADVFLRGLASERGSSTGVSARFPGVKSFNTSWGKAVYEARFKD